jgi:hypothetical protein
MPDALTPDAQAWVAKVSQDKPRPNLQDVTTVGHALLAGGNAVFQGGLEGIAALGEAVGQPQLGRDIAGYYEAKASGVHFGGVPNALGVLRSTLPETRAALTERDLAAAKPPAADAVAAIGQATDVDSAIAAAGEAVQAPGAPTPPSTPDLFAGTPFAPPVPEIPTIEVRPTPAAGAAAPEAAVPANDAGGLQSVGAATSRDLTNPDASLMSPDEFAANRLQGETERLAAPPKQGDTNTYIPGVQPTLAEVSGNPVDAMDQAYNRQQPEALTQHMDREGKTGDLVAAYYADTAGSAQTLNMMERQRDARASANIKSVFGDPQSERAPADPTPTLDVMQGILDDPRQAERDAVSKIIPNLMSRLYDADGELKTDPYALYGIGQHINDLLDKVGDTETSSAARVLQRELIQIRERLYDDIEDAAPGFAQYRAAYQADSQAINAMKLLQDARLNLLNGAQHITPSKWFTFMRNIVQGRADPMDPASALSEVQMDRLWNITDQLKRSTLIDAGKPRGSWTSMMQEWGGRFAQLAAHGVALHSFPVVGNALVHMGTTALRARSVRNEMNRVLNPDLSKYPQPIDTTPSP